ncbi:MAG: cytochrome P450 [Acidimicrobiales bacterium]|nr:cytochrome P450 [Acidimicrobiales bacterium]
MSATTGEIRFNPFDPEFVASPYEQYAILRDEDPVHWSDLLWGWVVTRHDDVATVLGEPTMSSDIARATPTPLTELELQGLAEHGRAARTIVHLDDPDHRQIRRLMADPFRVREVDRLRDVIDRRVGVSADRLAAGVATAGDHGRGRLDLVADFSYPLPVEIFSGWLGIPDEDAPQFRTWTSWVARSRDPLPDDERQEFFEALEAMWEHLEAQVVERRRRPADDLLTHLVTASIDGEGLSHEDLMAQLITLYMAGHEPTAGLVGNGVLALLRHPDQIEVLRHDRDLLRNAVSELLRYDGPNQFVRRITTRPIVLQGREIPAGAVLYVGLASANRDPRRWNDADRVVVDRPDASEHLQFGAGAHSCLGAHLARLQAERMIDAVLDRFEHLELDGDPVWSNRMFIRGLQSLPLRVQVRATRP